MATALCTVGTTAFPNPTKYTVTLSDLDSENSNRSETGDLHRDRVRAGVYKISQTLLIKTEDLKPVVDSIAPESVSVTFFDPNTCSFQTCTMYSGDRTSSLEAMLDADNPTDSLWTITFDLTEY